MRFCRYLPGLAPYLRCLQSPCRLPQHNDLNCSIKDSFSPAHPSEHRTLRRRIFAIGSAVCQGYTADQRPFELLQKSLRPLRVHATTLPKHHGDRRRSKVSSETYEPSQAPSETKEDSDIVYGMPPAETKGIETEANCQIPADIRSVIGLLPALTALLGISSPSVTTKMNLLGKHSY